MTDDKAHEGGRVSDGMECNKKTLIQEIASTVTAYLNCVRSDNLEWTDRHRRHIRELENELPHGSGIDGKNVIELSECTEKKIVIYTAFHHMTEGFYDGWTDHKIIVTPDFKGIDIRVTGRDRNDIKDYLGEIFHQALMEVVQ